MKIVGINSGFSTPGSNQSIKHRHILADGGAAVLVNGEIRLAMIEERLTRRRYSGGFTKSLSHCLQAGPISPTIVAFSSCCGPRWSSSEVEREIKAHPSFKTSLQDVRKYLVVGHHDSHAALGFVLSGFHRALVAVIDGFGNLLESRHWNASAWWRGAFERHSYYLAEWLDGRFTLNKVAADAIGFDDVGLGELYRALTHFSGWNSYQHAGSAMALAAFGNPEALKEVSFIEDANNTIRVRLPNNHRKPKETLARHLKKAGFEIPVINGRTAHPTDTWHCHTVARAQQQFENSLTTRLISLAERQAVDKIVVTGGAALNCLTMGILASRLRGGSVYVPPAPSDTGQGLGNALWAAYCQDSPIREPSQLKLESGPFWGTTATADNVDKAVTLLKNRGMKVIEEMDERQQAARAAFWIHSGNVLACCKGRSEYGPRALGGRSVLADPRSLNIVSKVNEFKQREPFRPFAPAILSERTSEFFETQVDSTFMSFAVPVRPHMRGVIPAVVHVDGTARLQTVARASPSPLRALLEEFDALTKVPVLLNTSFNRKGEPMVETPLEAAHVFLDSQLFALLLDGFTVVRDGEMK